MKYVTISNIFHYSNIGYNSRQMLFFEIMDYCKGITDSESELPGGFLVFFIVKISGKPLEDVCSPTTASPENVD